MDDTNRPMCVVCEMKFSDNIMSGMCKACEDKEYLDYIEEMESRMPERG